MTASMKLSTRPYKGARDFYPEDMRLQNYIFSVWHEVCQSFGYEEYTAPILENAEIYEAKSGQEIVNEEMYVFTDRGDRRVAIRPEMTPTVSRMVAGRRQELAYPLRWYSIPNLWRYDRPQRGRLREHWQLNADIFGLDTVSAETEIIKLADAIMKRFGAKRTMYEIRINSRHFVDHLLKTYLGLSEVEAHTIAKLIDKMHKMSQAEFIALVDAAMSPSHRDADTTQKLLAVLASQNPDELPAELAAHSSLDRLGDVMVQLEAAGMTNARFDVTLMRGFDYYTDIVFEVFDLHPDNNRSLFGGGRYDGLVGMFGVEPVPTVGFGQGDVGMQLFLESHDLLPTLMPSTELYIALATEDTGRAEQVISSLREEGVRVAVDYSRRKVGAQVKVADKKGIPFVVVLGDNELKSERFMLKNLSSGHEQELSLARLISVIKDVR